MKKRLIHILSFGFLLSVVTEYLACEKRRYFETNLIKFTGQYYEKKMLPLHWLFRFSFLFFVCFIFIYTDLIVVRALCWRQTKTFV